MRPRWFDWRLLSLLALGFGIGAQIRLNQGRTVEAFLALGQGILIALVVIAWVIGRNP